MAQWVECQTPDFGSHHDPRVMGSSPMSGSTLTMEPAEDSSLSPFASLPCSRVHARARVHTHTHTHTHTNG